MEYSESQLDVNILDFKDWMRTNTELSEGSINVYVRAINLFQRRYDHLTEHNINDFISKGFRNRRSYYMKYAFKYFLKYKGFEEDDEGTPLLFNKIVKVKIKPRKKLGVYVKEDMIKKIIYGIKVEKFRDIATLQYATGARAREIISLKEEQIDMNFDPGIIRLRLEAKGGKENITFLSTDYETILRKYMKGKPGYLFLSDMEIQGDDIIERAIQTQRTYFYNVLQKSARSLGLSKFGTHDFRRNVVELLKKRGTHIDTIKKALNHSSINTTLKYFDETPDDVKEAIIKHQEND